jgi:AcrR family transcriptional regulator
MTRSRPTDRFTRLVAAAAAAFITHGYQRTQMSDVADALGVAKGTVYGYVEGKAALLGAALRYADEVEAPPDADELPLRTPAAGELAALVADRLGKEVAELRLTAALTRRGAHPPAEELPAIIADLYRRLARHRVSIKLVDRCAPELPELADVWYGQGRRSQVGALAAYLDRHTAEGALRLPGPVGVVARTLLETCVLWAVHLHWDPARALDDAQPDDDVIAATLAGLLTRGLARDSSPI